MDSKQIKATRMVLAYPFVLVLFSFVLNFFLVEAGVFSISVPGEGPLLALSLAAILLCLNHSWLMTATELTRVKYRMYATPEEWQASGTSPEEISKTGHQELARAHNAHRNSTENAVFFGVLLIPFMLSGPTLSAASLWLPGFALARLGHTYSYLYGHDNLRGLFMSLGLLAMYGVASYPLLVFIL